MGEKFNTNEEIISLALLLRRRRLELGYTLKYIEKLEGIDCGQLSRFENGDFKTNSVNLQKYCQFLQIQKITKIQVDKSIGSRLEEFASRSPKHRIAAEEFLKALEHLL